MSLVCLVDDPKMIVYSEITHRSQVNVNESHTWECERKENCLGGVNSTCRDGHTGIMCDACRPGYFKQHGNCNLCPEAPGKIYERSVLWPMLTTCLGAAFVGVLLSLCLT